MIEAFSLKSEALRPDARINDLGVDSLALIEFSFDVEERFNVELPHNMDGVAAIREATLQDLADTVDQIVANKDVSVSAETHE